MRWTILLLLAACGSADDAPTAPAAEAKLTPPPLPKMGAAKPAAPAAAAPRAFMGTATADPAPEPQFDLQFVREQPAGALVERDGDWQTVAGFPNCRMLYKLEPSEAMYFFCNDQVVAGPLRTADEVRAIFDEFNQASRNAFEAGRRIREKWPTGASGPRRRVYDQHGTYLYSE